MKFDSQTLKEFGAQNVYGFASHIFLQKCFAGIHWQFSCIISMKTLLPIQMHVVEENWMRDQMKHIIERLMVHYHFQKKEEFKQNIASTAMRIKKFLFSYFRNSVCFSPVLSFTFHWNNHQDTMTNHFRFIYSNILSKSIASTNHFTQHEQTLKHTQIYSIL